MKPRLSLSLRLALWSSAVLLLGFVIFGLAMWFDFASALSEGRDKTLAGRSRRLATLLEHSIGDEPGRRGIKFEDFTQATPEGHLIQVYDLQGHRVYPAGDLGVVEFPWPSYSSEGTSFQTTNYQGRPYRVLTRVVQDQGKLLVLHVAGNLDDNRVLLGRLSTGLFRTIPISVCVSLLAGYLLSRRALHPIARLTATARSITIGNLSRRIPVSRTRDELQQLAETSNEMLARLENAVGRITRFTADASHELRSPISVIRTTAEVALSAPGIDEESAGAFGEIVAEAEAAALMLEDMLTLARSDAGHADTVFDAVDLTAVVVDTCNKIRPLAEAKSHTLVVGIGPYDAAVVTGDVSRLRRLIWILVDNAVKYTPDGGRIHVGLKVADGLASLSVSDNGVGIPPDAIPHIFDRFYRIDESRSQDGSGLGLAIAKWIADVHQAAISVDSAPNKGTTFGVEFRLS